MWIFLFLVLTDLFVWWRLLIDMRSHPGIGRAFVIAVKLLLTAALWWFTVSILIYNGEFAAPANAFRIISFGTISALTITLGIIYLLSAIIAIFPGRNKGRRMVSMAWINITIAAIILAIFADGFYRQRFELKIVREEITVDSLDPRLEGLRIVLISDLHLSSYYGHYEKLESVIDSVNALKPDLLLNTGDFVSYGWQEFGGCDTILRKARAAYGAFSVAGNHDDGTYHPDYDEVYGAQCAEIIAEKAKASGYEMLADNSLIVSINGTEVMIAGVVTHGHRLNMRYGDFDSALAGSDTTDLTILLVHDPAAWETVTGLQQKIDLVLSGHTHGMQIGFPTPRGRISPASIFHKYWSGHYESDGRDLFVTTGLGTMGMAIRIFMPPEIILLTLKSKNNY